MSCLNHPARPFAEALERRQLFSAAVVGAFASPIPPALSPGGANHITIRVTNATDQKEVGPFTVSLYASSTQATGSDAVLLTDSTRKLSLRPGAGAVFKLRFSSPSTMPDGSYFLVAKIDGPATADGSISQSTVATAQSMSIVQPFVDLTGQIVSQSSSAFVSASRPGIGRAVIRIDNHGNAPAQGPMQITVYASSTSVIDSNSTVIGIASFRNIRIKASGSKVITAQLAVPPGTAIGSYSTIAAINSAQTIPESDVTNNLATGPKPLAVLNAPTIVDLGGHHHDHGNDNASGILFIGGSIDTIYYDNGTDASVGSDTTQPIDNTSDQTPTTTPTDSGSSPSDWVDSNGSDFSTDPSSADGSGGGADF